MNNEEQIFTRREAAKFLGCSVQSLSNWATQGKGPERIKVSSRFLRYKKSDLIKWLDKEKEKSSGQGNG